MPRCTTDAAFPIDVRPILRTRPASGSLRQGSSGVAYWLDLTERRLTLAWRISGDASGEVISYAVGLSPTAPHLGGVRWWAHCTRCSRRCALLYIVAGRILGCRACFRLVHESTRETAYALACRRARAVRRRVRASMDLMAPIAKPPRMRWGTFLRHLEKEQAAVADIFQCLQRSAS